MPDDPRHLDPDRLAAEARSLRALARAAAGGGIDGEDLAQDAWVTALERPPERGASLRGWLAGIVRNHARDARRAVRRRAAREQLAARPESGGLDDTVERLDLLRHLLAEARRLEEPFRTAILLRYVDGLSTEAIARRLGVPTGTVRGRLHRGIERLRRRLDGSVPGGRGGWLAPFALYLPSTPAVAATAGAAPALKSAAAGATLLMTMTMKNSVAALVIVVVVALGAVALWPAGPMRGPAAVPDPDPAALTAQVAGVEGAQGGVAPSQSARVAAEPAPRRDRVDVGAAAAQPSLLVRGTVRSVDGAPIAGAEIVVGLRREKDDPAIDKLFGSKAIFAKEPRREPVRKRASSDAEGRFELRLPVASLDRAWGLHASARTRGFVHTRAEVDSEPDTAAVAVDLVMPAAERIAGRVVGPAGEAIEGARVHTGKPSQFAVVTDADGAFVLDDVDPGIDVYQVRATAAGFLPEMARSERRDGGPRPDLVIALAHGAAVEGTVFAATRPLAGAKLRILAGKDIAEAVSDAAGRFRFAAVRPGRWTLVTSHRALPTDRSNVDVPAVAARPGVVVRHDVFLEVGRALRGTVVARDGRPLAGAQVAAMRKADVLRSVVADGAGVFSLEGLPREPLTLRARVPGYAMGVLDDVPVIQEVVEFRLDPGAGFAATIVDAGTGDPIDDFAVRLWIRDGKDASFRYPLGGWESFTGVAGIYRTPSPTFPAGFVAELELRSPGFARARTAELVATPDPDPAAVRVGLERGAELVGVVHDSAGRIVAGAELELLLGDDSWAAKLGIAEQRATTGDDGSFRFEHVPVGSHRLRASHAAHGEVMHAFTVAAGVAPDRQAVRFAADAALRGVVRGPTGELLADVPVVLLHRDAVAGLRRWEAESDADGRFSFEQLPAGEYELQRIETREEAANGKPLPLFSLPVTLGGSEARTVELAPRGAGRIEGRLVADAPVPGLVFLRVEPLEGAADVAAPSEPRARRFPRWLRATDGAFAIPYLLPGRYRVSVFPGSAGELVGAAEVAVDDGVATRVELRLAPR